MLLLPFLPFISFPRIGRCTAPLATASNYAAAISVMPHCQQAGRHRHVAFAVVPSLFIYSGCSTRLSECCAFIVKKK